MVLNTIGLTGASGMLGRHVRAAFEAESVQVIAVSRRASVANGVASWDLADWLSFVEFDELFKGAQAIIHAGAFVKTTEPVNSAHMFDINVRATLNLGQWAANRNIPIIYISTSTVYAEPNARGLKEEAELGWSGLGGFYSLTKLLAEDALNRLRDSGLKFAIVRPSSLYGFGLPDDKTISRFLSAAKAGAAITLSPPVHDRIDFVQAADVSRAIMAILEADAWDIFNIASGNPISVKELAEACVSAAGKGSILFADGDSDMREPITRFALDISRARSVLGWQPKLGISQGLSMMMHESAQADI